MSLFFLLILSSLPLLADTPATEELFHVRRIESLKVEEDYLFLKRHIEEFRKKFPESPHLQKFTALLGNIAFYEKQFEEALGYYDQIHESEVKKTIQGKKWHS